MVGDEAVSSAAHRPMRLPYELYLAVRYLRFHRGRTFLSLITLISVAGVMVGTAALVIALSLWTGFVDDVRARIFSGSAHLTVMSADGGRAFEGAAAVVQESVEVPGVRAAAPVLYSPAMVLREEIQEPAYAEVLGIEPEGHARVILDGSGDTPFSLLEAETASGRPGILLGEQLARRIAASAGDTVRVVLPRMTLSPWGAVPSSGVFEVVGTYRSDHFEEDSQRAYVGLETVRRLLRSPNRTSWVEIRLDDWRRLKPMKESLREALGAEWLVFDLVEQNRELIKALNTEKVMLFLAIGLIVVVAALNIVSTLILMVADKVKEIGTLSAMGAQPRGIACVFILQGLVIGVVGTVSGLTLGSTISIVLDRFRLISLNPEVYYLSYLPFAPRPIDLAVVGVAAMLISLVATIYPAWRAARLDPVEALRHE